MVSPQTGDPDGIPTTPNDGWNPSPCPFIKKKLVILGLLGMLILIFRGNVSFKEGISENELYNYTNIFQNH